MNSRSTRGFILLYLLVASITAPLLALNWPSDVSVVTEFGSGDSNLRPDHPAPFLALGSSGPFELPADGQLLFRGRLPNGLGNLALSAQSNDLRILYGNLDGSMDLPFDSDGISDAVLYTERVNGWSDSFKPLIVIAIDDNLRQIINPEILLDNPEDNAVPSLRRLRFSAISPDGEVSDPFDLWSWYRRRNIDAGEYLVGIDWADGRFSWNDVSQIFSLRLYVNGQLKFRQGLEYLAENEGELALFPGRSADEDRVPVSLRPGTNIIELYIQDPKGLSQEYEFIINGGLPGPE